MDHRLAVVMMADLAGYTALMEEDPGAAVAQIRALRSETLEPHAIGTGGQVEKRMGDGWLITFGSATNAVRAAQSIQQGLVDQSGLKLRLALHLGEIIEDDGEIYGTGINIAARLQSQAPPGGLMISDEIHRQLDPQLCADFSDAGSLELKNVKKPVPSFLWRPQAGGRKTTDDLPVIAVAPLAATPQDGMVLEAAADLDEQLLHRLSQRTGVRVISVDTTDETSVDATYLLRGRFRAHGAQARIMLSMIRTDTGEVFWSETYERPADDLFAFSDYVADQADNTLRMQINAFDGLRFEGMSPETMTPAELRSRAALLFHRREIKGYSEAERLLNRAISLDPESATGHSMIIHAVMWPALAQFKSLSEEDAKRVVEFADIGVRGAPRSDFSFFTRAEVRAFLLGDFTAALQDVRRALQIKEGYVWALETRGKIELCLGQFADAEKTLGEVVERSRLDPWRTRRTFLLSVAQFLNGNLSSAETNLTEAIDMEPDLLGYWRFMAQIREARGDAEGARSAQDKANTLTWTPTLDFFDLPLPDPHRNLMKSLVGL